MAAPSKPALLEAYFGKKADLHRYLVARTGSADQADDLLQELYIRVAGLNPQPMVENPSGYLYRLATNLMLDRARQQRRSAARDSRWLQESRLGVPDDMDDRPDPITSMAARQTLHQLVAALDALSPQTRRVFRLHKFEGLSHAEVASRLGISRSAVEKHMNVALKHLVRLRS